jgi:hypothetical protein
MFKISYAICKDTICTILILSSKQSDVVKHNYVVFFLLVFIEEKLIISKTVNLKNYSFFKYIILEHF